MCGGSHVRVSYWISHTRNWFNAVLCLFSVCSGNYSMSVAWYCHCQDDFLHYLLITVKLCAIGKITNFWVGFVLHHHLWSVGAIEMKKAGRSLIF